MMMNLIAMFLLATTSAAAASTKTEVQVNICESFATLEQKLHLASWQQDAPETSYMIENPHLDLYKSAWVFKVRTNEQDQTAEVILKHNQADPNKNTNDTRKCEYDLHGAQKKWACKQSNIIALDDFKAQQNKKDFQALLSEDQKNWLTQENQSLPPNLEITTTFTDQGYETNTKDLKIELGLTKNIQNQEFIEISTRAKSAEAPKNQASLLNYLKSKSITLCKDQGPLMTRLKLESHFQN
jgi:uncharacterized cupredoxin-like copper-binding protein